MLSVSRLFVGPGALVTHGDKELVVLAAEKAGKK